MIDRTPLRTIQRSPGMRGRLPVAALLAIGLLAIPSLLPIGVSSDQLTVSRQLVPLAFAEEAPGTWISEPVTGRTTVAGLTWESGAPPKEAAVRARTADGWTPWVPIELDDEHAPDPDTSEARDARGGSGPVIVEGATELQFRVASTRQPRGLEVSAVRVDGSMRTESVRGPAADAAPSRPSMVMRSQWGGDQCLSSAGKTSDPRYVDRVQVMFVHHTATSNDYTADRAAAIVRGICDYHVRSRNFDDIAYNFLIDKFGVIYEGRGGGVDLGVQGAHTGGFNSYSTGMSFIGTHGTLEPTSPAQTALRDLASWKMDLHHIDPTGITRLRSLGSTKYASGTVVDMPNLAGHRDASSTSCPGTACYLLLSQFRQDIRAHGGAKLFDGWPNHNPVPGSPSEGYDNTTFRVGANTPTDITFQLLHGDRLITRQTASGTSGTFTWDGKENGRNVNMGTYQVRVTGTPHVGGTAPRIIAHEIQVGAFLPPFVDDDGNIHEADIAWIAQQGITKGCNPPANDLYCPDTSVTRGQMAAFLGRALTLTATSSAGTFTDVPSGHTFATDINKLATAGITKGCNPPANDRYCPGDPVTRDQMAAFLVRALTLTATSSAGTFTDVPSGHTFATDINKLATAGITKGCNPPANDRYCPTQSVKRDQMASFLARALK